MSMNDPLGDMITRIRNGQMAEKRVIEVLYSKLHENVCQVLQDQGYIRGYKTIEAGKNKKAIQVELKYVDGRGAIEKIERVSKPGRRIYTSVGKMPRFYNGLGVLIVTTPRGVMTDFAARQNNVGGEVLCQVF